MLPTKRLFRLAVVSWLVIVLAGLALGDPGAADVVLSTLAVGIAFGASRLVPWVLDQLGGRRPTRD
jgi:hypothetical protein